MPKRLLRRVLPHPQRILQHRLLGRLGPVLHHPRLWHVSRGGIALGAAIGLFFGLLIPVAQIPLAALLAITLRANLPMAVAGTFITNPITFAPIYYVAYHIGLFLTAADQTMAAVAITLATDPQQHTDWMGSWFERLFRHGKPLFVGLSVMAFSASVGSYFFIQWLWCVLTLRAWRRRTGFRKQSETTW